MTNRRIHGEHSERIARAVVWSESSRPRLRAPEYSVTHRGNTHSIPRLNLPFEDDGRPGCFFELRSNRAVLADRQDASVARAGQLS